MRQALHIFRKDVRALWLEIEVSLLVVAGFTWVTERLIRGHFACVVLLAAKTQAATRATPRIAPHPARSGCRARDRNLA